jgi:ElaA protein
MRDEKKNVGTARPEDIRWQWSTFDELTTRELYEIIRARIGVFCVEQNCPYQDLDGVDQRSRHLIGWLPDVTGKPRVVAYCRLVAPGVKYDEPSVGRVLTSGPGRGLGAGKELMRRVLEFHDRLYPRTANRIGAQQYLERFYQGFGFVTVSDPYDEDGIPHIEMLRDA